MDKEKWEEFLSQYQNNISYHNTSLHSNSTESLECIWHKLQTSIITAALKTIPNKKFTVRNFHHTFTPKASELHKDLKTIGNIMQQTKYLLSHNQSTIKFGHVYPWYLHYSNLYPGYLYMGVHHIETICFTISTCNIT